MSNLALKRNQFSVRIGTITHVLAISKQHVAVLAAVIYFSLRFFGYAVRLKHSRYGGPDLAVHPRRGAPPSAIRAGVVATLVLAAGLSGRQVAPSTVRTDNTPKVRFSATVVQEPEVEVTLTTLT